MNDARRPAVLDELTQVVRTVGWLIGEIQFKWAEALGLTVPQWNILVTVMDAGDAGISVKVVAAALNVHPSFVVNQSRPLEDLGLIRRAASHTDKRLVLLTVTAKAKKQLSSVANSRDVISRSLKEEVGEAAILHTVELLRTLERSLQRCRLRAQLEE